MIVGYVDEPLLPYRVTNPGATRIRDEIAAILNPVTGTAAARALGATSTRTDIRARIATALDTVLMTVEKTETMEASHS